MEFTLNDFNKYVEPGAQLKRHIFYDESVKKFYRIRVHSDGEKPGDLLTKRRPSESEKIHKYREDIFEPITKSCFDKIYSALMKIRKAKDWNLDFPKSESKIREDETLKKYLEIKFPKYTSLTNWYFQIGLRTQLVDTNAKVFVRPLEFVVPDNEYIKPYPFIFNSDQVIDYQSEKYYVLRSREYVTYTENNQTFYDGLRWYVVTDTHIQIFDQYTRDGKYKLSLSYIHELGFVPVYDFKGTVLKEEFNQVLYDSKIEGTIPFLNEAIREYSDIQAEVVQHVHSTLWAQQGNDCRKCKGTGEVISKKNNANVKSVCDKCGGHGFYPFNPFENIVQTKPAAGETPRPSPPAGFIEKQTAIVEIQDKRIEGHFFRAYSAINFEFLSQSPIIQSGIAKSQDKDEANNFVHGVAEDGVELLDNLAYCSAEYRYKKVIPDQKKRKELLPTITVPEKYDLVSDSTMLEDLSKMKGNVDSSIFISAEIDYAKKRFNTDPKIADLVSLKLSLDPFGGDSEDSLLAKDQRQTVTRKDLVIHDNISEFIERALEENNEFPKLLKVKQKEILLKYAEEKIKEIAETTEPAEPTVIDPVVVE